MPYDPEYERAVDMAVTRIRETVPADLAGIFGEASGISRADFHPCRQAPCGDICAVDGSNTLLLESGSLAIVLFRAAQSTFHE
ncbi:MAG: hypothetical protein LUQ12_00630, partial [Methanoregulaceae archaeon]|nr:hypothetical protein [Methanoregulaceae archaeon]